MIEDVIISVNKSEIIEDVLKRFSASDKLNGETILTHNYGKIEFFHDEKSPNTFFSSVPSTNPHNKKGYNVAIRIFSNDEIRLFDDKIMFDCNCPQFSQKHQCKHCYAALKKFSYDIRDNRINYNAVTKSGSVKADASWVRITSFIQIDDSVVNRLQNQSRYYGSLSYSNSKLIKEETPSHFILEHTGKKNEKQEIVFDIQTNYFNTKCSCGKYKNGTICEHIASAFGKIKSVKGKDYFHTLIDYSPQKNKVLLDYGVEPDSEDSKHFILNYGLTSVTSIGIPPYYITNLHAFQNRFNEIISSVTKHDKVLRPKIAFNKKTDYELGFLFSFSNNNIKFILDLISVTQLKQKKKVAKISLRNEENLAWLETLNDSEYELIKYFSIDSITKEMYKRTRSYTFESNRWFNYIDSHHVKELEEYLFEKLYAAKEVFANNKLIYFFNPQTPRQNTFSESNSEIVNFSSTTFTLKIKSEDLSHGMKIGLVAKIGEKEIIINADNIYLPFFIREGTTLYIADSKADYQLLQKFQYGFLIVPNSLKTETFKTVLLPLQKVFEVELPETSIVQIRDAVPQGIVVFKELENKYLFVKAVFNYETFRVEHDNAKEITIEGNGKITIINRDKTFENNFHETIKSLHHLFAKQQSDGDFFLAYEEVMKNNWFIDTLRFLQDNNFIVEGITDLKHFKYNTNKPTIATKVSSSMDWFDLAVEIKFGEQLVPFIDIVNAIKHKQTTIMLGDGTIGVLPEEWIKQFGLAFKMGNVHEGKLQLSKMHFTLIDELHLQIDDETILQELAEKKKMLSQIEDIKTVEPSKKIKATLRNYQLHGLYWMQTLDKLGWGGCLADDMGLGKTLQAIAFLQYLKEKNKKACHLVVCPTSLIYNWENEIKKFCNTLKYHIYYGADREFENDHLQKFDVIITSYGTLRNDIEILNKQQFHYFILDESQAIKNPEAQISKAVQLIKAKNKLILTGTPVQNNTYDLYSQFNFLNPGFLGNRTFFKTEFANAIDKDSNVEVAQQLKKMIYPFMLRRTKQQVAKDLPDKTEIILWCEMAAEQRTVYEQYKNYYRNALLKKIEEVGMSKVGIYVLEGLLRLRQICDSPQLLKSKDIKSTKSVKIEELLREIQENSGDSKVLIFSQFTEMLKLIKEAFDKEKVVYNYLDGSTPALKRQAEVDDFQTNEKSKAFLISLKAGGVGLNLTAADYVYLIDPWWNPAVEQQAIDRTHRIGQTKKVFAYKMICKDSVEEKIIKLQEKKKSLSKELVGEENGFMKKLTKDDVEFLFT